MAKGQQGVGAITIWMIVFVFFWLVSTVWLVILYTGQEELRVTNSRVMQSYRRVVTDEEMKSIEPLKAASENGPTAVGILEEARGETARLATGDPKDNVGQVRTKRDDLIGKIKQDRLVDNPDAFEDASLHDALTLVYEAFKSEQSLRKAAESRQAELDAKVAQLEEEKNKEKANFDSLAQTLQDRMNTVESDRATYREERDTHVATLAKDFDLRRAQTDADLTSERQKHRQKEKQLSEMQSRFERLQDRYSDRRIGPAQLSTARKPDGRILLAVAGDDIVYTDLGKSDRLVLGLKFAVYTAAEGIPPDGKAKAQLEVVSISADSSECRVLWLAPSQVILEGDWIANAVYDPDRAVSFLVLGDFDLNRDGQADANGRAVIESIVTDWGGTVTDEVTALTDFVVIGAAPTKPRELRNPTPDQTARLEAQQKMWTRYQETVSEAKSLAIPTMTQDVFLNFIGQPSRLPSR